MCVYFVRIFLKICDLLCVCLYSLYNVDIFLQFFVCSSLCLLERLCRNILWCNFLLTRSRMSLLQTGYIQLSIRNFYVSTRLESVEISENCKIHVQLRIRTRGKNLNAGFCTRLEQVIYTHLAVVLLTCNDDFTNLLLLLKHFCLLMAGLRKV